MSRLWPDRVYAALGRQQVGLIILKGPWGNTIRQSAVMDVPAREGLRPAQAAVNVLSEALAQEDVTGAVFHLTLSDVYARYVTVPPLSQVRSARERDSFAAARFAETFGDVGRPLTIKCDSASLDRSVLACGIESELLASIGALRALHKLRLSSVSTVFVRALNRWRDKLSAANGLVLSMLDGAVVSAAFQGDDWTYVAVRPLDAATAPDRVVSLLRQEAMLSGSSADASHFVIADPRMESPPFNSEGIEWLYAAGPAQMQNPEKDNALLALSFGATL